ncbi:Mv-ORF41 peptide [Maruca vitrata nucleopolyhedrovirus]|uniref:Mv-ORF41 peptide n=1 Tax=Maruca vitrata nucleopolyhedrovirus TaxID=1307954 RepID=A1YRA3_9ABAC|nr:Mv-ORF41 peptide [Maruca vitrata nucleopolyhedrovirus]ABL75993.1 Mv-ORF41 peptide [Maruca vitrata nucleopolyhedrovirus]
MKKVSLGKIIENTVESKYKSTSSSINTSAKLNLSEYYKTFESNKVGRQTTYNMVGMRDYKKIDELLKKY